MKNSNNSTLGGDSFKLDWEPIPSPISNTTEFTGNMTAASEQIYIIREDYRNRHQTISIQELLANVVKVAEKTASFGEMVYDHLREHGPTYGVGGISIFTMVIGFILYMKKRGNDSSSGVDKGKSIS